MLTSHGRGVAVVEGLDEFGAAQEQREFMRTVVAGLADIEAFLGMLSVGRRRAARGGV